MMRMILPATHSSSSSSLMLPRFQLNNNTQRQQQTSSSSSSSSSSRNPPKEGEKRFYKKGKGISRRAKPLENNFQFEFTEPVSNDPRIAILGGGMSGLLCAKTLQQHGIRSTVFDTGMHGLGGRMATREIETGHGSLVFDHGAQFFTVSDPEFQKIVDEWLSQGIVKEWNGSVGTIRPGEGFTPLPPAVRYCGTNGMRHFANSILKQDHLLNIVRPCWVSKIEPFDGKWNLYDKTNQCGEFDFVVIAHNGKCANRLLMSAGIPLIAKQMKRLELSSIWALLASFDEPLPLPEKVEKESFEGAFVEGLSAVSWMGNNTSKLLPSRNNGPYCWTFFSTAAFGKRHKVPQESIPTARAEKVKKEMLRGVEIALGLSRGSLPQPSYTRLQLWGAALPMNTPSVPCIFDPLGRAGICGDWLLGSSLEAAALSGIALANHIAKYCAPEDSNAEENAEEFSIGLSNKLIPLTGHDIGQFPGTESLQTSSSVAEVAISEIQEIEYNLAKQAA